MRVYQPVRHRLQVLGSTQVNEDTGSTGNCQTNTAFRIQDSGSDAPDDGVNAGEHRLSDGQPGISWSRGICASILGGNVGIGMETQHPLEVDDLLA
jgi:hypothetical protein